MNFPLFVVSDLHIGSGGPRDSFCQNNRSDSFDSFLDYVEMEGGELIILGDFIDLWRFTIKKVIKTRRDLLDRLAEMNVCCVPGNHDMAFNEFVNSPTVPHPLFRKVRGPFVRIIGGRKFSFMHGHELDPLNRNVTPRVGRMLGLSFSLLEYARGRPFFSSDVIEEAMLNSKKKMLMFWLDVVKPLRRFRNMEDSAVSPDYPILSEQNRIWKLLLRCDLKKQIDGNDVTVSAHTHRPCRCQDWYFNSGSWAGQTNDFVQISPSGRIDIYKWENNVPRHNDTVVNLSGPVSQLRMSYAAVN